MANKREHKRRACAIAAHLIDRYRAAPGDDEPDREQIDAALDELVQEMVRRAGDAYLWDGYR